MKWFFYILLIFITSDTTSAQSVSSDPLKIGLLIQKSDYKAATQAALLAIKMANQAGGLNGRPFEIIIKGMEGPWGTGSKQAVDLIFQDEVWALVGSHDGRNAHLVEQAATKSLTVFISAWSSDPSLSQAFVPWFFNCVPDDLRQSEILLDAVFNGSKSGNIIVITDKTYESKQAFSSFLRRMNESGTFKCIQLKYEDIAVKPESFLLKIKSTGIQNVILFCSPLAALEIVRMKKKNEMSVKLYGSLSIPNEEILTEPQLKELDGNIMIPAGSWSPSKYSLFSKNYQKMFGKIPGITACYSFDAMSILIEAIRKCKEPEREEIQKALTSMNYEGVTGLISFGNLGNRKCELKYSLLKNGVPAEAIVNKLP